MRVLYSLEILSLEVSEQISSLTYHLEKASSGVMILLVNLEVFVQIVDSVSENRNLNFRHPVSPS